jgi:hypothetical protein
LETAGAMDVFFHDRTRFTFEVRGVYDVFGRAPDFHRSAPDQPKGKKPNKLSARRVDHLPLNVYS